MSTVNLLLDALDLTHYHLPGMNLYACSRVHNNDASCLASVSRSRFYSNLSDNSRTTAWPAGLLDSLHQPVKFNNTAPIQTTRKKDRKGGYDIPFSFRI